MNAVFSVRAQTDILYKNDSPTFSTGGMARQQNLTYSMLMKVANEVTYLHETGPSRAMLESNNRALFAKLL